MMVETIMALLIVVVVVAAERLVACCRDGRIPGSLQLAKHLLS